MLVKVFVRVWKEFVKRSGIGLSGVYDGPGGGF